MLASLSRGLQAAMRLDVVAFPFATGQGSGRAEESCTESASSPFGAEQEPGLEPLAGPASVPFNVLQENKHTMQDNEL